MNEFDKKLWELTKKYIGKKHGYNYRRELRLLSLDDDWEQLCKEAKAMDESMRRLKEPPPIRTKRNHNKDN